MTAESFSKADLYLLHVLSKIARKRQSHLRACGNRE